MSERDIKDVVELLEFTMNNGKISVDECLALSIGIEIINEHDSLIDRAEKAEALLRKALEACDHCPNKDGVCGDSCSILDIRIWNKTEEAKNDE